MKPRAFDQKCLLPFVKKMIANPEKAALRQNVVVWLHLSTRTAYQPTLGRSEWEEHSLW